MSNMLALLLSAYRTYFAARPGDMLTEGVNQDLNVYRHLTCMPDLQISH